MPTELREPIISTRCAKFQIVPGDGTRLIFQYGTVVKDVTDAITQQNNSNAGTSHKARSRFVAHRLICNPGGNTSAKQHGTCVSAIFGETLFIGVPQSNGILGKRDHQNWMKTNEMEWNGMEWNSFI